MNNTLDQENFKYISYDVLKRVVDHAYDEIFVYDNDYKVLYVNKACERHYGMKQKALIGKDFKSLLELECWYPSILPSVYKEKRRMTIEQTSFLGEKLITTAVPLFDENNEIEYVVMSVRDAFCDITLQREKIERSITADNTGLIIDRENIKAFIEDKIITRSKVMEELIDFSKRVSNVDSTILIHGESGTGKSILAKYIHENSNRKDFPFLTINCAAIPEDLLESELFGYSKGAFTGASKEGKVGLIELAANGTLFLDEIGELSLRLQAKILHVIQNKQFIPIGGKEFKTVDIRIITATNKDLYALVKKKEFREDLFWRLNVVEIEIPPLRERKEDIVALSNYFLNQVNKKYTFAKTISEECKTFFLKYQWPGNVRQLENLVERLVITSKDQLIGLVDLPKILFSEIEEAEEEYEEMPFEEAVEEFERKLIRKAYEKYKTTRKIAEVLEISQSKASRMIRKYCS